MGFELTDPLARHAGQVGRSHRSWRARKDETGNSYVIRIPRQKIEIVTDSAESTYAVVMIDLGAVPIASLLELHVDLLAELRRREVVRSANNPTGDYGELLFSRAFGWALNGNSSADADATDAGGIRYQIKCRRLATPKGSRQLGFIRRLPEKPFDQLAAVLLNDRFRVTRAALIPYDVVRQRSSYVDSVKAWKFMLRDSVWDIASVVDVTGNLQEAELSI